MAKSELKEQLQSYESYINDIPNVIDPCKQCEVYKQYSGYSYQKIDEHGDFIDGDCVNCCWFYGSKFKVGV